MGLESFGRLEANIETNVSPKGLTEQTVAWHFEGVEQATSEEWSDAVQATANCLSREGWHLSQQIVNISTAHWLVAVCAAVKVALTVENAVELAAEFAGIPFPVGLVVWTAGKLEG